MVKYHKNVVLEPLREIANFAAKIRWQGPILEKNHKSAKVVTKVSVAETSQKHGFRNFEKNCQLCCKYLTMTYIGEIP